MRENILTGILKKSQVYLRGKKCFANRRQGHAMTPYVTTKCQFHNAQLLVSLLSQYRTFKDRKWFKIILNIIMFIIKVLNITYVKQRNKYRQNVLLFCLYYQVIRETVKFKKHWFYRLNILYAILVLTGCP